MLVELSVSSSTKIKNIFFCDFSSIGLCLRHEELVFDVKNKLKPDRQSLTLTEVHVTKELVYLGQDYSVSKYPETYCKILFLHFFIFSIHMSSMEMFDFQ